MQLEFVHREDVHVRRSMLATAAAPFIALCAQLACARDATPGSCVNLMLPGVVVYLPGIDVLVRDANGRGEALGTKVVVYRGADSMVAIGFDTLLVNAGYNVAGTFNVRVNRPFYRDTVISNVIVADGRCTVVTTELPVTLQLIAGAPRLRSLAVVGAQFMSAAGAQRQLQARFDADPSVPATVTWRLTDTTLARIDAAGLVTAKCSVIGGVETVSAVASVDTTVKASAEFGVARQSTCP